MHVFEVALAASLSVGILMVYYFSTMSKSLMGGSGGNGGAVRFGDVMHMMRIPHIGGGGDAFDDDGSNADALKRPYHRYIPAARKLRYAPITPSYRESFPPAFTGECAFNSSLWKTCDAQVCRAQALPQLPRLAALFNHTSSSSLTGQQHQQQQTGVDFVQQVLRRAWGDEPPMIDLYVRAGCRGAEELAYMLHTLVLFYPVFLGDIIIVLDANDKPTVDFIVPKQLLAAYSVHVVFEHQPCLPGRLFNQYSYLNLHRYSQAEYVITIDSDCAFHRPVTPDVLFNRKGELILPTSTSFQPTFWHGGQMYFTRVDERAWGHSMVSQPVSFRVESFLEFKDFVRKQSVVPAPDARSPAVASLSPRCYEGVLADFYNALHPHIGFYCWMCQMSTFIKHAQRPGYDVLVTNLQRAEDGAQPYMRYASHITYERASSKTNYGDSVMKSTVQGMCYWFGTTSFPECAETAKSRDFGYVRKLIFTYAGWDLNPHFPPAARERALVKAKARLSRCVGN